MKRLAYLFLLIAALLTVPLLFRNPILTNIARNQIEKATGFQAAFEEIHVGLLRPVIRIRNLVLTNPPDFPHPEMLTVREVYVRYDRISLFGNNLHLEDVRLDIPRVVMIKPEGRASNIEVLTGSASKKKPAPGGTVPETQPGTPPPDQPAPGEDGGETRVEKPARTITIDRLNVKLGEMEVRQYSTGRPDPLILPVPVGLDRTFTNVTNLEDVAQQLAGELVIRSAIGVLNNLDAVLKSVTDENGKLDPRVRDQFKELKKLFR